MIMNNYGQNFNASVHVGFGNCKKIQALICMPSWILARNSVVGVERGVATRTAQMVWSMMTVTVTNFEPAIFSKLLPMYSVRVEPSKFVTVTYTPFVPFLWPYPFKH